MKKIPLTLIYFMVMMIGYKANAQSQDQDNPLEQLSFYMGLWSMPEDDHFVMKNPQFKDLKIIDFEWGANKKVIHSKTGIYSGDQKRIFSEGIITYNPTTKKLVWLEFQIEGTLLFEGEYKILGNNKVQREYTVHYPEGDETIPHPDVSGWTRLYRETFIPTSENSINWVTEIYINGKWQPGISGGDTKAVRDEE